MNFQSRLKKYEHKVVKKNGVPLQGIHYMLVDKEDLSKSVKINFKDGKIHHNDDMGYAVWHPDGLTEDWDNGVFLKIVDLPYNVVAHSDSK